MALRSDQSDGTTRDNSNTTAKHMGQAALYGAAEQQPAAADKPLASQTETTDTTAEAVETPTTAAAEDPNAPASKETQQQWSDALTKLKEVASKKTVSQTDKAIDIGNTADADMLDIQCKTVTSEGTAEWKENDGGQLDISWGEGRTGYNLNTSDTTNRLPSEEQRRLDSLDRVIATAKQRSPSDTAWLEQVREAATQPAGPERDAAIANLVASSSAEVETTTTYKVENLQGKDGTVIDGTFAERTTSSQPADQAPTPASGKLHITTPHGFVHTYQGYGYKEPRLLTTSPVDGRPQPVDTSPSSPSVVPTTNANLGGFTSMVNDALGPTTETPPAQQ
jgi:hypothetical protein